MYTATELKEYLDEIREQVCSRCVERPTGGPPCLPLGKKCVVELDLPALVDAVHGVNSPFVAPYLDSMHQRVCPQCTNQSCDCPCPGEYLMALVAPAIETVDQRRLEKVY